MRVFLMLLIYLNLSQAANVSGNESAKDEINKGSAVVFMYHRFGRDKYSSTNIRLEQFDFHLDYIEKNGFTVWPLSKIVKYITSGQTIPPKTIAISVDDAYITTYTNSYPRLKAKNIPFTVFVNTNPVDNKSVNYMSWDQMREMSANGVEFANHSLTHEYLLPSNSETKQEWEKRFKREVNRAQKRLQQELGADTNENPKLFAYPFGEYNTDMGDILRSMGYIGFAQASGVIDHKSDLRALPRYALSEIYGTPKGFTLKINTLPLPVESVSPWEPVVDKENPPVLKLKLARAVKNIGCFISSGERIEMKWISKTELELQAREPLKSPRDRYTCTAPAGDGKWYWHSHMWIIK